MKRFILMLCLAGTVQAQEAPFAGLKRDVDRIEHSLARPLADWNAKYEAQLEKLEKQAASAGKLERVVTVRKERETYADADSTVDNAFPGLKRARKIWEKKARSLNHEQAGKSLKLWSGYRNKLKELEISLTRDEKIDAAVRVQTEGKAAERRIAELTEQVAALKPVPAPGGTVAPPGPAVQSGELVAFGTFNNGDPVTTPKDVRGFTAVAAAGSRYVGLRKDGNVHVESQPGVYANEHLDAARRLKNVTAIAVGNHGNLALHRDGTVTAWGRTHFDRTVPRNLEKATAVAAGSFVYLVLHADGKVTAWGHYLYKNPKFPAPEQLTDAGRVAAGENRIWVENKNGDILFSHAGGSGVPEPDEKITRVAAMASGVRSGCLFLTESGNVIQWGGFQPPGKLPRATAVRAGGDLYAAQRRDGTWLLWGPQPLAGKLQAELDRIGPLKDLALASSSAEQGFFAGIK